MATTTKKSSKSTKSKAKTVPKVEESIIEEPIVDVEPVVEEAPAKKTFKDKDGVKCVSITAGELFMPGIKTQILYSWVDAGDVAYVEYADLVAEVRTKGMYAFRPRFVVDDEDFIAEFPELDTLYASLYSKKDLSRILKLEPAQMRKVISDLPDGAKESIKSMAVSAIERGELDSINRIKVIDEIFGTEMLLKMMK